MRNIFALLALAAAAAAPAAVYAQNKPLDHSVYDGWQSVRSIKVSPDGQLVSYEVAPQEGDGTLFIKNLTSGAEVSVPRGTALKWPQDASFGLITVKAPFARTRQAKIDKKKPDQMPKDSLARIDLRSLEWKIIGASGKTDLGYETAPYLYSAQEVKGRKSKNLLVINTADWSVDTLKNVSDFKASAAGTRLVAITAKEEKDSLSRSAVIFYDFPAGRIDTLSAGREAYANANFNAEGNKIVFTATDEKEKKDGTPHHAVYLAQENIVKKATRRTPAVTEWRTSELLPPKAAALPEGWVVGEKCGAAFSNGSSRIVLRLHEYMPPKDTTVYEFEAAQLDIWVWDKRNVPPMDKKARGPESRTAMVNLDRPGELLVLSGNASDRISFFSGAEGDYALSMDTRPYDLDNLWSYDRKSDISLVNLRDGSRRMLREAASGYPSPSPYGKYLAWFDQEDGNWYSLNIATGVTVNLTGDTGVIFWDDEDDHPTPGRSPVANAAWAGNDEYLLVTDRYDVWKLQPDGKKAECITRGQGRRESVQYRPVLPGASANPFLYKDINTFPTKGLIWLTAFDRKDKRNGFAQVDIAKGGEPKCYLAEKSFTSMTKAENAELFAYLKGDFRNPYDLYVSKDFLNGETKLTAINLQQAEYRWGDVELVHWNAYDGTPLDGLLFTPDGLDMAAKHPMMIYFYEKNSDTRYNYRAPAPSRSIINISFYVSRGYVVFVPDIVYKDCHPGESAYNCICAGTEAMCKQFSYIDKTRMAIQGQSWGGYQTAYLVTRTDMFAAAGAGAPVGNMTSAYGGIRWESGNSRITQYEFGQSRIGKTLWEDGGLDLYVENSPVFFAPNVKTPVLIMHNDADGAVPWYQGIEFFMSLRRLGKPAWLLEYNKEAHNLAERRNCKDLSIRLQQFFDHYLMGAPEPVWMQSGIPYARKGNYFATELAE